MGSPQVSETSQNPFMLPHPSIAPTRDINELHRDHRIYGELLAGRPYTSIEAVGGPPEAPYQYHIFWRTNSTAEVVRRETTSRAYEYIRTQIMSEEEADTVGALLSELYDGTAPTTTQPEATENTDDTEQ